MIILSPSLISSIFTTCSFAFSIISSVLPNFFTTIGTTPQFSDKLVAVLLSGVVTIIGQFGLYPLTLLAVYPLIVDTTIAFAFNKLAASTVLYAKTDVLSKFFSSIFFNSILL